MPEEFDPAWEYATCDPYVEWAVYGGHRVRRFARLGVENWRQCREEGRSVGFRFGRLTGRNLTRPRPRAVKDRDRDGEERRRLFALWLTGWPECRWCRWPVPPARIRCRKPKVFCRIECVRAYFICRVRAARGFVNAAR